MLLNKICVVTFLLLDVSSIVLNGFVEYVLKKHKKTRIVTFCFIYYLSISDVMVGLTELSYHSLQLDFYL